MEGDSEQKELNNLPVGNIKLKYNLIKLISCSSSQTVFTVDIGLDIPDDKRARQIQPIENLKILVVDDDLGTCEHTALVLDRIGTSAEWMMSGKEAIAKVIQALSISDDYDNGKMPEMDRIETTRKIRKNPGAGTPLPLSVHMTGRILKKRCVKPVPMLSFPNPCFSHPFIRRLFP